MSRRRNILNTMKEQAGRNLHSDVIINRLHGKCLTQEKLPPRLPSLRGIQLAARVVSHEIRDFTKKNTGKDLAAIRDSKFRNDAIEKINKIKGVAQETKTNFLTLAAHHSTNLTTSLSPDDIDYGFRKVQPQSLVARYHKQCRRDETNTITEVNKNTWKNSSPIANRNELQKKKICRCHDSSLVARDTEDSSFFLSCWEHKGINEEELNNFFRENSPYFKQSCLLQEVEGILNDQEGWSEFIRNEKCTVYRKKLPIGIYEYRVQATFKDVSAKNLFKTQVDGEYRKKWDEYVINLDVVDSNPDTSSELVHWVTKCPYPFSSREYVYLRRHKIDKENKAMILCQQATDQTNIPKDSKISRIETYKSKIIIKSHSDFNDNGCDFLLTYYDDPKMRLPARVIDFGASRGIADSVNHMHQAALDLEKNNES